MTLPLPLRNPTNNSVLFFPYDLLTYLLSSRGSGNDDVRAQEDKVTLAGVFCGCSALQSDCLLKTAGVGSRKAARISL